MRKTTKKRNSDLFSIVAICWDCINFNSRWSIIWSTSLMILTWENRRTYTETCSGVTLSTTTHA